jgi:hypothetical protein
VAIEAGIIYGNPAEKLERLRVREATHLGHAPVDAGHKLFENEPVMGTKIARERLLQFGYLGPQKPVAQQIGDPVGVGDIGLASRHRQWHRNTRGAPINWRFTTEDARIKLLRLYPKL